GDGRNPQPATPCELRVGDMLRQGDRVVVGKDGKVGLKYDGEATTIELMAVTEAAFGREKGAKRVTLAAGKLVCSVAPQAKAFEMRTPHAVARVVGTRFSLDVADKQSRLAVQAGRVAFAQGENSVTVSAGQAAVATATGVKMAGGVVYAWGQNQFGLLGVGTTNGVVTAPMRVAGLDGVSTVIAGAPQRMFALRNDGSVWTWGGKKDALLGKYIPFGPVPVPNLAEATAVAYGGGPGLALTRDGTVWDLGMNRLGDGTTNHLPMPVQVSGLSDVIAIAAGPAHSLAVTRDGTVWAWGQNNRGQLGDGTTNSRAYPVPAKLRDGTPLGSVVAVAAGACHSVALRRDGSIWSWGSDDFGQCDGMERFGADMRALERVTGLDDVTAIAAQGDRTVALRADGTVYAFGSFYGNPGVMLPGGRFYQPRLADGSPLSNVIAIAIGFHNTVALRSDGSVWSWGGLVAGPIQARLPDGAPLSRITAIAAGAGYTLAVGEE
ncbi:MAG: FecR domain-containing protein, partial [Magnetococcus sp. WYHC-3]